MTKSARPAPAPWRGPAVSTAAIGGGLRGLAQFTERIQECENGWRLATQPQDSVFAASWVDCVSPPLRLLGDSRMEVLLTAAQITQSLIQLLYWYTRPHKLQKLSQSLMRTSPPNHPTTKVEIVASRFLPFHPVCLIISYYTRKKWSE